MELLEKNEGFIPERHGQNLALPVVYVPYSVDSDVSLPTGQETCNYLNTKP